MAKIFGLKYLVFNVVAYLACDLVSVCGQLKKRDIQHSIDFKRESILHYDFEQTNGTRLVIDRSGNGRDATMGTDTKSEQGKCGEGIAFRTESLHVNTESQSTPENKTTFEITVAAWILLNTTRGERTIFKSYHETDATEKTFLYFGIKHDNKLRFSATSKDAVKNNFKANIALEPAVWQHVAVSYKFSSGTEVCDFFVDGKKLDNVKHQGNPKEKSVILYPPLGRSAVIGDKNDVPFILDNFYILKALFPTEIQDLVNDACKANSNASIAESTTPSPIYQSTSTTKKMTSSPRNQPKSTTKKMNPEEGDLDKARKITNKTEAKSFLKEFFHERIELKNISTVKDDSGREALGNTEALERIALILARNTLKDNESVSLETTSALFVMKLPYAGFIFPHAHGEDTKNIRETMTFPDDMVKTEDGVQRAFVCMSYKNIHESMPREVPISGKFKPNTTLTLNSKIIGAAVSPALEKPLTNPIKITFSHDKISSGRQVCSFWNHSIRTTDGKYGSWSTKGCEVDEKHSTSTKTVCLCDHLTNFALLLQREGAPHREPPLSLQIITIVGCSLSILACLLCFLMFLTLKRKDIRHYLHINLTFAIAVAQLILLFGITQTKYEILCKALAAFLHYFYLVAFLLMLCEGVHLAILIETAFSHGDLKLPTYLITSWGLPLVIVGITLGARFDNYGGSIACFISADQGTVYAFVGPFALILVINFVILVIVLRQVIRKTSLPISSITASKFEIARATIRSLAILFPVMGFTWVFGILYFGFRSLALEYLFAIFCSLQGFFIFLLQYALNTENRSAFVRATRRWRLTLTSSLHSSADPAKQTGAANAKKPPDSEAKNGDEVHTSTVDNCHLMLYRNLDNGGGTIDSRTTSTFI